MLENAVPIDCPIHETKVCDDCDLIAANLDPLCEGVRDSLRDQGSVEEAGWTNLSVPVKYFAPLASPQHAPAKELVSVAHPLLCTTFDATLAPSVRRYRILVRIYPFDYCRYPVRNPGRCKKWPILRSLLEVLIFAMSGMIPTDLIDRIARRLEKWRPKVAKGAIDEVD